MNVITGVAENSVVHVDHDKLGRTRFSCTSERATTSNKVDGGEHLKSCHRTQDGNWRNGRPYKREGYINEALPCIGTVNVCSLVQLLWHALERSQDHKCEEWIREPDVDNHNR